MGVHSPIPTHRRVAIEAEIEIHLLRVERLIARLDRVDGDADLEPNGDEADASGDEADASVPEWAGYPARVEPRALAHEDAEDDDPGGGAAEDASEPEHHNLPRYGINQALGPTNTAQVNRLAFAREWSAPA